MKEVIIKHAGEAMMWLAMYFSPTYSIMLSIAFFVLVDMYTGIRAAQKRGESVNSKKLRDTVSKFVDYGVGVIVACFIQKQFLPDVPAMQLVAGLINYIEIKSINENIYDITGVNMFQVVLDRLKPPSKQ